MLKARVRDHRIQSMESLVGDGDGGAVALTGGEVRAQSDAVTDIDGQHIPAVEFKADGDCGADAARGARYERRATLTVHMSIPPLTSQVAPVMNDDWSATRKCTTRAISSGLPSRPTGMFSLIALSTFSGTCSSISVATKPGATVLTVMPMPFSSSLPARLSWNAASRASVFVNPSNPDFDAA